MNYNVQEYRTCNTHIRTPVFTTIKTKEQVLIVNNLLNFPFLIVLKNIFLPRVSLLKALLGTVVATALCGDKCGAAACDKCDKSYKL